MGEKRIQKKKERKTNKQTNKKTNSWEQYLKSLFRKMQRNIFPLYGIS